MQNKNEQKFYEILENLFIGAKITPKNDENGFISLLRAKSDYFSHFCKKFETLINEKTKNSSEFKEEIYDKLYDFFHRYFNESGALLYERTPAFYNLFTDAYTAKMPYEPLKSAKNDTELFYKTKDLYYVKSEKIYNDLTIELDGIKYEFDANNLKMKKSNEKQKELDFSLTACENLFGEIRDENAIKNGVIKFTVNSTSSKMSDTKITNILKELAKANLKVDESELKRAFKIYEKQSNIDFFINKNAKEFLSRQLDLWIYQYLFTQTADFNETRIKQISDFKEIALNLINFISQFENELCKIWLKPRFAINSNFVVSLSTLKERGFDTDRLKSAKDYAAQESEWRELSLKSDDPLENENLAIDTRYFPEFKDEISKLLENSLDGTLIKSENFGALNSIKNRFKNSVDLIYIDPPYNTGGDGFIYADNFNHSSWLSMMSDRLKIARANLSENGVIFISIDDHEQAVLKILCDEVFGERNFISCFVWQKKSGGGQAKLFYEGHEYILIYAKNKILFETNIGGLFKIKEKSNINNDFLRKVHGKYTNNKTLLKLYEKYPNEILEHRNLMFEELNIFLKENLISKDKFNEIHSNLKSGEYFLQPFNDKFNLICKYNTENISKMYSIISEIWNSDGTTELGKILGSEELFDNPKPEALLYTILNTNGSSNKRESDLPLESDLQGGSSRINATPSLVLDFFAGSGTTLATAHKMGRKWLGVEMGEHFDTVILPRMKKVLSGEQNGISKSVNFSGGGCFKYYELESYEQILRNIKFSAVPKGAENLREVEQDYFLFDEKLSHAYDENLALNLKNLGDEYANIDLKESFLNYGIKEFDTLDNEKIMQILRNFLVW